jgi:hypothetical protein
LRLQSTFAILRSDGKEKQLDERIDDTFVSLNVADTVYTQVGLSPRKRAVQGPSTKVLSIPRCIESQSNRGRKEPHFGRKSTKPPLRNYSACRLESEACVKLNLTPGACGREYAADILGEIASRILKNGISVPAQSERTLRVTRDRKVWMIE